MQAAIKAIAGAADGPTAPAPSAQEGVDDSTVQIDKGVDFDDTLSDDGSIDSDTPPLTVLTDDEDDNEHVCGDVLLALWPLGRHSRVLRAAAPAKNEHSPLKHHQLLWHRYFPAPSAPFHFH